MSAEIAEFLKKQSVFSCERMNASISKKQCDINRYGQAAGPNRMAIKACLSCEGCPGLGQQITELKEAPVAQKICSVDGCGKSVHARGMCWGHERSVLGVNPATGMPLKAVVPQSVPAPPVASVKAARKIVLADPIPNIEELGCTDFIDALDQAWIEKRKQMLLALVGADYRRQLRLQLDMLDALDQIGEWA